MQRTRRNLIVDYNPRTGHWFAAAEITVEPSSEELEQLARARRHYARTTKKAAAMQSGHAGVVAAARTFPNNAGNYPGKRTPATPGRALEPRERFNRLAAHVLGHRMNYRNFPRRSGSGNRRGHWTADGAGFATIDPADVAIDWPEQLEQLEQ